MPKLTSETCRGMAWQKSSTSEGAGMCVEVAAHAGGGVAVRHSASPEDGALLYTESEFAAFLEAVKRGEFDRFVGMPAPRAASRDS